MRAPISWLVDGDGNSTSVYNYSKYLTSSLDWNKATDCNNKTNQMKVRSKDSNKKIIMKSTWNGKILKNMSKDRYSSLLVVFSSSKA